MQLQLSDATAEHLCEHATGPAALCQPGTDATSARSLETELVPAPPSAGLLQELAAINQIKISHGEIQSSIKNDLTSHSQFGKYSFRATLHLHYEKNDLISMSESCAHTPAPGPTVTGSSLPTEVAGESQQIRGTTHRPPGTHTGHLEKSCSYLVGFVFLT